MQQNAMNMPTPATRPSCATPMKLAGVKARKPAMLASDATRICAPARRAVCSSACSIGG